MMDYKKYKPTYFDVPITDRQWTNKKITKAPIWCSVDLRDGNQALFSPMSLEEKIEFFKILTDIGFKEIEVGFPASSDTEYTFVRTLIENDLIPDDVKIQVLTQSRKHIIDKTIEAIKGAKNVIIHLYNSVSKVQRKVVFGKNEEEILQLSIEGAKYLKEQCETNLENENVTFEYSPESFSCTEPEFALKVSNAVLDVFKPTAENPVILNLPASIEVSSPNIFADQVEYISTNLKNRDNVILSIHTHNDRGCAVASSELGLLAGADRVEGTLFGNGERTGNADLVVLALNLYTQGINPDLNLENLDDLIEVYEKFNKITIHPRHPYSGDLAFTAFSGSHQDAIKKSMDACRKADTPVWENPYLTIDPTDIGREYEPIQINSQSGRGGIHYVLENKFGLSVPRNMLISFTTLIKSISDKKTRALEPEEIYDEFCKEFVNLDTPIKLLQYRVAINGDQTVLDAEIMYRNTVTGVHSVGNGPLDAMNSALQNLTGHTFDIDAYSEHALTKSASSKAVSYICLSDERNHHRWGAGIHANISTASIQALISAVNKLILRRSSK